MSGDLDAALLRRACLMRWAGRHVAGLAQLTKRPKATAASWLSGRRQMPGAEMQLVANILRDDGYSLLALAEQLAKGADIKRSQQRRPRGFQIVKDWDGTGAKRDARWHGGRRKKPP